MMWYLASAFLLFNLLLGIAHSQSSDHSLESKPRNLLLVVNQGDQR